MMNVKEFIKEISKETGYQQKDITTVLDTAEEIMINAVAKGDGVKIFKSLSVVPAKRKERVAYNPITNEAIKVPAKTAPKAKFSQAFRDIVK